jgi:hypothetical protein
MCVCVCVCLKTSQGLAAFCLLAFRSSKMLLWMLSATQWHHVAKNLKTVWRLKRSQVIVQFPFK